VAFGRGVMGRLSVGRGVWEGVYVERQHYERRLRCNRASKERQTPLRGRGSTPNNGTPKKKRSSAMELGHGFRVPFPRHYTPYARL
jgi:hypothetical protein